MNCGLAINLSCHFIKFGNVMLMSKGFSLISSNPNQRNVFIGYPKETGGYTFYHISEGKIFVAKMDTF